MYSRYITIAYLVIIFLFLGGLTIGQEFDPSRLTHLNPIPTVSDADVTDCCQNKLFNDFWSFKIDELSGNTYNSHEHEVMTVPEGMNFVLTDLHIIGLECNDAKIWVRQQQGPPTSTTNIDFYITKDLKFDRRGSYLVSFNSGIPFAAGSRVIIIAQSLYHKSSGHVFISGYFTPER